MEYSMAEDNDPKDLELDIANRRAPALLRKTARLRLRNSMS